MCTWGRGSAHEVYQSCICLITMKIWNAMDSRITIRGKSNSCSPTTYTWTNRAKGLGHSEHSTLIKESVEVRNILQRTQLSTMVSQEAPPRYLLYEATSIARRRRLPETVSHTHETYLHMLISMSPYRTLVESKKADTGLCVSGSAERGGLWNKVVTPSSTSHAG